MARVGMRARSRRSASAGAIPDDGREVAPSSEVKGDAAKAVDERASVKSAVVRPPRGGGVDAKEIVRERGRAGGRDGRAGVAAVRV